MLKGHLTAWWEGRASLAGGENKYQFRESETNSQHQRVDNGREELFSHLRVRVYHNPDVIESSKAPNRRRTDLMPHLDDSVESAVRMSMNPPLSHIGLLSHGSEGEESDQFNVGGMHGILGHGSTARASKIHDGGFGRRFHEAIQPHNDGSQVGMQAAINDLNDRQRNCSMAFQLDPGGGVNVQAVSRKEHVEHLSNVMVGASGKRSACRKEEWDSKPLNLMSSAVVTDSIAADPRRKATDVTSCVDAMSAVERDGNALRRLREKPPDQNLSDWRKGDTRGYCIDFSEPRKHTNHLSPNQAAWRSYDTLPYRIDLSVSPHTTHFPAANGRKYSDIMHYVHPDHTDARDGAHGGSKATFGPRANSLEIRGGEFDRGLSWGEMQRRGLLDKSMRQSASEAVLLPHSLTASNARRNEPL